MSGKEIKGSEQTENFKFDQGPVDKAVGREDAQDTRISYEPTKEDLAVADAAADDAAKLVHTLADKVSFRVIDQFSFKFGAEGKTKDINNLSLLDSRQLNDLAQQAEGNISTLLRAREQLDNIRTGFNRTVRIGDKTFVNDPSIKYKVETPNLRNVIGMIDNFIAGERENSAKYRALATAESLEN
jgi:hypothetical protein